MLFSQLPPTVRGVLPVHLVKTQISIAVQKFKTFNQTGKITSCRSGSAFVSTLVSIEARAPDKLKSKIWFKQYVDFGSLKKKFSSGREFDEAMSVCNSPDGER